MDYEFSFEEADALLMRDWFYEDEDIDDLIWLLTEEVFHQVYEKRHSYPYRVSLALRMHEPIKTKAADFTNEMMDEMIEKEEIERIILRKKEKEAFICIPRPRGDLDDRYDELKQQIERIQKSKYSMEQYRKEYVELKNEFEELEKKIDSENRYWIEEQWIIARSVVVNPSL